MATKAGSQLREPGPHLLLEKLTKVTQLVSARPGVQTVDAGSRGQAPDECVIFQRQRSGEQFASSLVLCHVYSKVGDGWRNHALEGRASGLSSKQSPRGKRNKDRSPEANTAKQMEYLFPSKHVFAARVLLVSFPIRKMGTYPARVRQWRQELISSCDERGARQLEVLEQGRRILTRIPVPRPLARSSLGRRWCPVLSRSDLSTQSCVFFHPNDCAHLRSSL